MKIHRLASSIFVLQLAAACSQPSSSRGDEGVPADLPCGGVDLQTDDRNCGACGNECFVWWPGTEYEAGGCADGECLPLWTGWFPLPTPPDTQTCDEFCAYGNIPCVPRGCSGMTALVCGEFSEWGNLCELGDPSNHALAEFGGECDEPIPYPKNVDEYQFIEFTCCCDYY